MKLSILPTFLFLLNGVSAMDSILSIHGSGTTNPGMCVRSVMEEMEQRAKLPVRLTFRGIGSTLGIQEFINGHNNTRPIVDFEMSEIPISNEDWLTFQNRNVTVLQIPSFFGGVSFFYNLPEAGKMNLTSCLLAKVFKTEITDWAHPEILAINPGYDAYVKSQQSLVYKRIRVAVRELGSSSALAITEYLHGSCPEVFGEELVGSMPKWSLNTIACRGTTGMSDCISQTEGTIGFLDSGYGVGAGLQEVAVKNKYGTLLTSQEASRNGGIGLLQQGIMPSDPRDDFSAVSILDQEGEYAWPITLASYTHILADLKFMEDPMQQSLLVAFIKALHDPSYTEICKTKHGFELPQGPALELIQKAVDILERNLDQRAITWTFEEKPNAIVGAGDYVFSANRRNFPAWDRASSEQMIKALEQSNTDLQGQVKELSARLEQVLGDDGPEYTEEEEAKLMASLILASLSTVLVLSMMVLTFFRVSQDRKA